MSKLPTLQKIQFESNQWTVYFMELFFIVVRLKQMVVIVKRKGLKLYGISNFKNESEES